MQNLTFSSAKKFKEYSQKIARNSVSIKLNPLRIAMARADGFQSVASYYAALDQHEADMACFTNEEGIYLTNGSMEDTDLITQATLDKLNLPYQTGLDYGSGLNGFYPLSKAEEVFLSDEPLNTPFGYNLSMGYSLLLDGKKHLVVAFEVNFEDDGEKVAAKRDYDKLKKTLILAARNFDKARVYYPDDVALEYADDSGLYACALYVPFESAMLVANDCQSWIEHLEKLFGSLSLDV